MTQTNGAGPTGSGAALPDLAEVLKYADLYRQSGFVPLATYVVLGWTDNGRPICSCHRAADCPNAGKHPIGAYKDIDTPDKGYMQVWNAVREAQTKGLSVNLALRTGPMSGMFVVDLDRKEGVDGIDIFGRWLAANNLAAENLITLQAKSGGGGHHYVFRHPAGIELAPKNSGAEFGRGIDIKTGGQPFHVYPSNHKNGGRYQWLNWGTPLGEAPSAIVRAAQKKQTTVADVGGEYTPSLVEVREYADELAGKRGKQTAKQVGLNMQQGLAGQAIAKEGGGHDAFRDIAFYLTKRWPTADADTLCSYFAESIQARLDELQNSNTSYADVLRGFQSAQGKIKETAKSWIGKLALSEQGTPLATEANFYLYFTNHPAWAGALAYNERRNRPFYVRKPPLDNKAEAGVVDFSRDRSLLALWFQNVARMSGSIRERELSAALISASYTSAFDPMVHAMMQLRGTWDGVPRLETALQRVAGAPDTEWVRLVFPLWVKSLVARLLCPGAKVDTMLILEGRQGLKKSTFFSSLLPDPLYFSDSLSRVKHDQETIRLIHSGPAIFELGELSGMRKQEVEDVKAFLSAYQDDLRPLYESPRTVLRRCVFVGTTNRDDYLRDETGGRRFWPVTVTREINIGLVLAERMQWFAEAIARLDAGETWWLENGPASALAQEEQDARYEEDTWHPSIAGWLADRVESEGGEVAHSTAQMIAMLDSPRAGRHVTVAQVAEHCLKIETKNLRGAEGQRITRILRRLGWERGKVWVKGARKWVRYWKAPSTR